MTKQLFKEIERSASRPALDCWALPKIVNRSIKDEMMATINPYINFNGNAEEAFTFYKSVFGGRDS